MGTVLQDVRYGVRMLLRKPSFAVLAVLALGLGIGGNVAMFSVIDAVLLRPLPYSEPDRLVAMYSVNPPKGWFKGSMSAPDVQDYREQSQTLSNLFAYHRDAAAMTTNDSAVRLREVIATTQMFDVLGVNPVLGRGFRPEEGIKGHEFVAVLSNDLWRTKFASNPNIVGSSVKLDGNTYQIIGVTPRRFHFPTAGADIYVPFPYSDHTKTQRGAHYLTVIGRMKPGVTAQQVNQDVNVVAARLAAAYPDKDQGWTASAEPLVDSMVGKIRPALLILLGAVAFLALIGCANIANLLLARATEREREISVRTAMGASRWRIIRQLLTESFVLSAVGCGLGILLAFLALKSILQLGPKSIPRLDQASIDGWVLLFAIVLATITAVLSGLLPALRLASQNVTGGLKSAALTVVGSRDSGRLRSALMVGEVAISVMLLIGAGLLIKSFVGLRAIQPGFDSDHVLTFNLSLPEKPYTDSQHINNFYSDLEQRLRALPGVKSVGTIFPMPMTGDSFSSSFKYLNAPQPKEEPSAQMRMAGIDYFTTMHIPLLKGRLFNSSDINSHRVLIASEAAARKFFPNGDAIGKVLSFGASAGYEKISGEIVGIVGNTRDEGLDQPETASFYYLFQQAGLGYFNVVVRTSGDPDALAVPVTNVVHELDPLLPVADVAPVDQVLAKSIAEPRFYMLLLGIFAALALSLAIIGVYGVISYTVNQRVREIGIRLALGAQRDQVLWMVVKGALSLVAVGLAIGVVLSLGVTGALQSLLFGISPRDLSTFVLVSLCLTVVALVACYVPARRASRVDPMKALRYE